MKVVAWNPKLFSSPTGCTIEFSKKYCALTMKWLLFTRGTPPKTFIMKIYGGGVLSSWISGTSHSVQWTLCNVDFMVKTIFFLWLTILSQSAGTAVFALARAMESLPMWHAKVFIFHFCTLLVNRLFLPQ